MNMLAVLITALLASQPLYAEQDADQPSFVVSLTEANIDQLVYSDENTHDWLIVFGAPWCKFCQLLEPEFAEAAKNHPIETYNVKFAKADCTTEKSFNTRFNIEGYPTIKLIRDKITYNTGSLRNQTDISHYVHRVVTMPVLRYTAEPVENELRSDPHFILYGDDKAMDMNAPLMQKFSRAAWRMLPHSVRCYRVHEPKITPYLKRVSAGAESITYDLSDEDQVTVESLMKWMEENKRALVAELKVDNFMEFVKLKQPWAVLAIDPKKHETALNIFREAAAAYSGNYVFVWINSNDYPDWLKNFGITKNAGFFTYDPNMERHWRSPESTLDSSEKILSFLSDVKDGKIEFIGPGKYHPAYLLRQLYQFVTSTFFEYSFSYQFAATLFCILSAIISVVWFGIKLLMRSKTKKEKAV